MTTPTTDVRKGWTSASNALADSLCSARHLAQRGIPEPVKGPDATGGTAIHEALAKGDPAGLTLEQRETFNACLDIERRTISQLFGEDQVQVFRHRRFWANIGRRAGGTVSHSGEADYVAVSGNRAAVVDYKTLAGDQQESPKNMQLRDLVVLVRGELGVENVAAFIVQPFVTHTPEVTVYTKDDIDKAQHEMFQRVIGSNDPNSKRTPGEPQCDYCLAGQSGQCVEYQKWAGAVVPLPMLQVLEIPMAQWTPEQLARAADALGPAFDLLEKIKAFLKEHVPPGWKLQPGNKRETITDPQECFKRFAALGGSLEQFMLTISVGKTKLKEQVNAVTGATGMNLDKAIDTLTQGIVETSQNAPSLKKQK
jgi:hypothetical protein